MKKKKKKKQKEIPIKYQFKAFSTLKTGPFRSIKVPLKSILRDPNRDQPVLNNYAFQINKTVILAYQLIRLYIINKYQNKQKLPTVDEKLYETALSLIVKSTNKIRKSTKMNDCRPDLFNFFQTEFRPLITDENRPKISNIGSTLQKLRVEMQTSFTNNLSIHYYKRLSKTLSAMLECTNKFCFIVLETKEQRKIHSTLLRAIVTRDLTDIDPIYHEICNLAIKDFIPGIKWTKNLAYDLVSEPLKFLGPTLAMADYLEKHNKPSFQAIPLRASLIPKHFPINSITLRTLMDCKGLVNKKSELEKVAKDSKLKKKLWNHYFKLDKHIFNLKGYNFFYSIDTDGFSCTLKYLKTGIDYKKYGTQTTKLEWNPPKISELSKSERLGLLDYPLVGIDPGKWVLAQLSGPEDKKMRYQTQQRWNESGYKRNLEIREEIKNFEKIQEVETMLNDIKSKSVDVLKFKDYIKTKAQISLKIENHYCQVIYRKLKFRNIIKGKSSVNKLISRTKTRFGADAIILYGNWSRSDQMRGIVSTPGASLRKKYARNFRTYDIDEFGTSKYCMHCHKKLNYHYIDKKQIYRIRVCNECSGPKDVQRVRFIHRDVNGAFNILKVGKCEILGQERPNVFRRQCRIDKPLKASYRTGNQTNKKTKKTTVIRKKISEKTVLAKEMVQFKD